MANKHKTSSLDAINAFRAACGVRWPVCCNSVRRAFVFGILIKLTNPATMLKIPTAMSHDFGIKRNVA